MFMALFISSGWNLMNVDIDGSAADYWMESEVLKATLFSSFPQSCLGWIMLIVLAVPTQLKPTIELCMMGEQETTSWIDDKCGACDMPQWIGLTEDIGLHADECRYRCHIRSFLIVLRLMLPEDTQYVESYIEWFIDHMCMIARGNPETTSA